MQSGEFDQYAGSSMAVEIKGPLQTLVCREIQQSLAHSVTCGAYGVDGVLFGTQLVN